jgi:predicted MFS family arabinose efflux permease
LRAAFAEISWRAAPTAGAALIFTHETVAIPNPWRGLRGLPADVWLLFATTLVNRTGTMALPFLVLYLTQHMRLPAQTAGAALTVYGIGSLCSAPVAGRLCDRLGALRVMEISLFLSGALLLLFPLAHSFPAVLALTLAWSLAGEAIRPASLAALAETTAPEQRRAAVSLNRLAVNLGMSIGPAAGGLLATLSFPILFVVDGASSLAAGVVLAVASRRMTALRSARGVPVAEAAAVPQLSPRALADGRFLLFLAGSFLVGIIFFQHSAAMPLFLVRDLGLSAALFGILFLINTVLIVLLEVPLNLAMAGWPHRRTLVLGCILCGVGFGSMALASLPWHLVLCTLVWTFGEMILFPGTAAYVADVAPAERRGEYMGAYTMSFGLAFTVGPWAGTVVLERAGAVVLWSLMLVLGIAAAFVMSLAASRSAPGAAVTR